MQQWQIQGIDCTGGYVSELNGTGLISNLPETDGMFDLHMPTVSTTPMRH